MSGQADGARRSAPLGVGLVGAGGFGRFCLEAYAAMPEVRVVAVADADVDRAEAAAPPGATATGDVGGVLADPRVAIVAVATVPASHGRIATEAARAGKHVFVEKPLATSMAAAEEAVDAASAAGVQFSVDYVLRHHPLHRLAAEIVHGRVLGPLEHWRLENLAAGDDLPWGHWFWDAERSGGILVEHGVHFIDLCNHLAGGRPDVVWGTTQRRPDGRTDRAAAVLRYGDGLLATHYHAFTRTGDTEQTRIDLTCARGRLRLDGWIPTRLEVEGEAPPETVEALAGPLRLDGSSDGGEFRRFRAVAEEPDRTGAYRRAVQSGMRDLARAVTEGVPPEVGAQDALASLAVALEAAGARGTLDGPGPGSGKVGRRTPAPAGGGVEQEQP